MKIYYKIFKLRMLLADMGDYAYPEKRRKGKDKKREKRKHPYKRGGKYRGKDLEVQS